MGKVMISLSYTTQERRKHALQYRAWMWTYSTNVASTAERESQAAWHSCHLIQVHLTRNEACVCSMSANQYERVAMKNQATPARQTCTYRLHERTPGAFTKCGSSRRRLKAAMLLPGFGRASSYSTEAPMFARRYAVIGRLGLYSRMRRQ